LRKPFLANDVLNMIRRRLSQRTGLAVGDTARR